MALPTTGSMTAALINTELGRASNAAFSMNGTAERALAAKTSGAITFADFRGKASEIVKTLTGGSGSVALESLFTAAEWTSTTSKRVVLNSGQERGSTAPATAAVTVGTTAFGGNLTLDVSGTISGAAGAANGGVGGPAINANITGASGQKLNIRILSGGVVRGGGGGGGKGGKGGNGYTTSMVRTPTTGYAYSTTAPETFCMAEDGIPMGFMWNGVSYEWGTYVNGKGYPIVGLTETWFDVHGPLDYLGPGFAYWGVIRYQNVNTSTANGGAGGNGGRGEGYTLARANGSAGAAGGTGGGAGGTGGRGGLYGAAGAAGGAGVNGTHSNGAAGSAGGAAGFAVQNSANATITNNGTLTGRT